MLLYNMLENIDSRTLSLVTDWLTWVNETNYLPSDYTSLQPPDVTKYVYADQQMERNRHQICKYILS